MAIKENEHGSYGKEKEEKKILSNKLHSIKEEKEKKIVVQK